MRTKLTVPGLDGYEQSILDSLFTQLIEKSTINQTRSNYYEARQQVRQLGISIPPSLENLEISLGWPEKSVTALESRINFDSFVIPGATDIDTGINKIVAQNKLNIEATMTHTSVLKYGCGFLAAMAGSNSAEPEVIIRHLSAKSSTGLYNTLTRRIDAALSITGTANGNVTEFILYLADQIITCSLKDSGSWKVDRVEHTLGRCPVVLMPFRPSTEDPFGRSRLSRGVMSLTDQGIRSLLRLEVSNEFNSAPKRYILGADEEAFVGQDGNPRNGWDTLISSMLALSRDEDGEVPEVGTFEQMKSGMHDGTLRTLSALVAGETDIPVGDLGIIHENPSSDAAMQTAYQQLNKHAERAHDTFGAAWSEVMQMAIMIRDGLSEVPEQLELLETKWRNPATPTKGAASQFAVSLVSAGILPADSDVVLEELGFDAVTIARIQADRKRANAGNRLASLVEAARNIRPEGQ